MLIETVEALYGLLDSMNEDSRILAVCMDGYKRKSKQKPVSILMSDKYREIIALDEKEKKLQYPIVVIYDNEIDYDVQRFYNNKVESEAYEEENNEGLVLTKFDIYEPFMPYNLNYRIEIVCKQRMQLDNILLWVMQNIPDRGCLDVIYKDVNKNDCIYNSLMKRGPIIKADEGTSSTLYRRTFELRLTTLLDGKYIETVTQKSGEVGFDSSQL